MKAFLLAIAGLSFGPPALAVNYSDVLSELDSLERTDPDLVEGFELGENDQGQMIYGVKVGPLGARLSDSSIHHLVVGTHHGDERLSANVALEFVKQIVAKAKTPVMVKEDVVYHVIPVLNIGGYNSNRREERDRNGRYLDSNRDYPDPCSDGPTFRLASTGALADYMMTEKFVGAVTIHGYIGTFTYPWGIYTTNTRTPDQDKFRDMAQEAVRINRYRFGTHADVIYPAAGAFEDWAYHALGVWTMLLELKRSPHIEKDARTLVRYFELVPDTISSDHDHYGSCRKIRGPLRARP